MYVLYELGHLWLFGGGRMDIPGGELDTRIRQAVPNLIGDHMGLVTFCEVEERQRFDPQLTCISSQALVREWSR